MLKGQVTVVTCKAMLTKEASLRSLKDPEDVLVHLLPLKAAFPDLVLFAQLVLTMPVSSANAERSFTFETSEDIPSVNNGTAKTQQSVPHER